MADGRKDADRQYLLSRLGEVRDMVAREFADEIFAQRLGVTRQALDVAVAGVDALYQGSSLPAEATRILGAKAQAETAGENPGDVNVAPRVGDKDGATQLPDPDEKWTRDYADPNPVSEAAPGNMTTDPEANPRLKD